MIYLQEQPGTFPTVSLGCGTWCTFNYTSLIATGIAIAVTLLVCFFVKRKLSPGAPGRFQMVFELLYGYVKGLVRESVAEDAGFIVPLAMTIGLYILIANWLDFFPLDAFGIHPANADVNQTAAMALVVFLVVQGYSIKVLGVGGYFRRFTKPFEMGIVMRALFVPLNIIEELVKPVTLALRLFGNVFAGGVMVYLITLLLGGLPIGLVSTHLSIGGVIVGSVVMAVWKLFDVLFIGSIQAFIFMLLTVIYFGMAREGLEEEHHREPLKEGGVVHP